MRIHGDFLGGNITVKGWEGDTVYLENQLRDTDGDWFYFAFCVEGAEGKTLTFSMQPNRLGFFGPAVSYDLKEWRWLDTVEGDSFTYTFSETESKVYFAHHMLYHPDRFFDFAKKKGLALTELCQSRGGRSVPCVRLGEGKQSILLTARHHACESTGSYVLEGVLEELVQSPIENAAIFCVPFVDLDGVCEGDQGKSRRPHDHNRDYGPAEPSLYPECAAIRSYADRNGCLFAVDFHSPWHKGGENDTVFVVRNSQKKADRFDRFSHLLEAALTEDAMSYSIANDHPPMTTWNRQPSPSFGYTMSVRPECNLAFSLETAYFGTKGNKVSQARLLALGRCFARAMKAYLNML